MMTDIQNVDYDDDDPSIGDSDEETLQQFAVNTSLRGQVVTNDQLDTIMAYQATRPKRPDLKIVDINAHNVHLVILKHTFLQVSFWKLNGNSELLGWRNPMK